MLFQKSFKINYFCQDITADVSLFCQISKNFHILSKIKDIFHGPHKKFAWFVVIFTSIFIFMWIVGPGNTFVHWIRAGVEIRRQEKMMEMYRNENAELDRRINMMKTDRDTLEKFAREQYNFAAPGEDVYVMEDDL